MKLFIERENKSKTFRFNGTVSKLLRQLKVNPATILVARNKALVTENDKLIDSDEVKILSVISGG
ncbi:MoaD/ThiS family protein [Candidatus Woesearchaeota archaeon]|nr:MoaD/ThiS family protein [Candidatus Woesearchaeota archaeon]